MAGSWPRPWPGTSAAAGWVVVSGLARGIDRAAHRGALAGGTIAVLAGGIDNPYPPESEALYREIAERGLLVAEMPLGTVPQARHFPRRNRIVSGLGAGDRGGRGGASDPAPSSPPGWPANRAGRSWRCPARPSIRAAGAPINLIRQGAILVEGAADVVEALSGAGGRPSPLRASR